MMDTLLVTFAMMALAVVITPGPTVLLALSNGARFGFHRALYGILGAGLSDCILIAGAALGLGAVMATSAVLFSVVKWIGVLYLLWLGVQMLRSARRGGAAAFASKSASGVETTSRMSVFRTSFLVAVTNPKGYLFFTAFLPQFLILTEPLMPQYLLLTMVFVVIDMLTMAMYAGFGQKVFAGLGPKAAMWLDRTCGGILVLMATALAFIARRAAP